MKVAIIDCGAGNLHSVQKAFAHVAGEAAVEITTAPDTLARATHIVLPGVGTYGDCMQGLLRHDGLREALETRVLKEGAPMMGICVGMQMLLERGHEFSTTEGLGWFKGEVTRLHPNIPPPTGGRLGGRLACSDTGCEAPLPSSPLRGEERSGLATLAGPLRGEELRIPHMGWNELIIKKDVPLFARLPEGAHAYFVHSYHATGMHPDEVLASVDYGGEVVACIGRDNIVATQFHPEKSQAVGLTLIENFVRM